MAAAAKRKGSLGAPVLIGAMLGAAFLSHGHHGHGGGIFAELTSAHGHSASQAIAYARAQVGKPYCWGGTGPSCYDCSGLTSEAYGLPSSDRTAAQQWAGLPHVRHPRPGDLVFAPGSDGSASSPGHVGLVIRGGRVIQAYATGTPVEVSSLRAFAAGAGGITGYARPGGA
jgi:cell wall-associated NlpC family hydrolase